MSEIPSWALPKESHCAGCAKPIEEGKVFVARLDAREWHRACWDAVQAHFKARAAAKRQRDADRRELDRQYRTRY